VAFDALVSKRFAEIDAQSKALRSTTSRNGIDAYDIAQWQQWATSALNIIRAAFGDSSPHAQHFAAAYAKCSGWREHVDAMKGIFSAAKADYDGGYAFSLNSLISGEIYGDFVTLAKASLSEGHKDVAAVLACAALEDALKRYASLNGLVVSDSSMQAVVNALKSKGLVGGAQKTFLDAMPKIRDYAMHANWEKITPQDVGSVLGFTEQLLLSKFS
jgi:hypothetical protein